MEHQEHITLGFCWMFADCTPEEGLPRLREYGFEGIELWPSYLETFGAERWARALAANEMRCVQLCPYFNFMQGQTTITASHAALLNALAAARILACKRVRVFTGPPWGEGMIDARDATEQQWQDTIQSLQVFCDLARQEQVELCLECHAGQLMENSSSTLRLLNSVQRSNLTVNLQLPLRAETWTSSLSALAPYTTHMHIHNWTQELGKGSLTYLNEGVFDWLPVLYNLTVTVGCHICVSVEHADHHGQDDSWETARRDGAYLEQVRKWLATRP
jgi:Sugar phosphate isomerases/epimerases